MNYDHRRYVRCSNDFTVNFIIEAAPESLPLKSLNSKQLINHRNPAEADELIKPLFRLEKFRNFVEKLLEGQDIEVNFNNLQMDNDDMDALEDWENWRHQIIHHPNQQ
uniref:Uncharacterized protein n=1 Tax=Ditylenchus dipsaci TaxID=166011 RepID=A0A915DRR7_9BILA